jgi:hypothetical protein
MLVPPVKTNRKRDNKPKKEEEPDADGWEITEVDAHIVEGLVLCSVRCVG